MIDGRRVLGAGAWLGGALALAACGSGGQGPSPPIATATESGDDDGSVSMSGPTESGTADTGGGNCGGMSCTGHGSCVELDGVETCECDDGYEFDTESGACVVDETCIEIRYLEDRCRQVFDGAPAVTLFYALDFCAGTAVLPADIDRLGLEIVVEEDGSDIDDNVESYATKLNKNVESYVTLAIDVSESVELTGDLPALVEELRAFVQMLAPAPGESDVYVSLDLFGEDVVEYLPFTRDFDAVEAALAAIETDYDTVAALAGGKEGTDLYDAVELGIERTNRGRKLRDAATWGGALTTGTVVIVTDGINSTGGMLDTTLIDGTTNQVISIGISDMIDDETLGLIGRDGSFLAPTVDEWSSAFSEIAQRVDQYPERSYLLGYCSSLNEGDPNVEVKVRYPDQTESINGAVCKFLPGYFGTDPEDTCSGDFFLNECEAYECGGITACGACAADECCTGHQCEAPKTATDVDISCAEQDELCEGDDQICDDETGLCVDPAGIGQACGPGCEPGVAYCDEKTAECVSTVGLGEPCTAPEECETLHCEKPSELPTAVKECLPPVEMYGPCGQDVAICETGAYCSGAICVPKMIDLETCTDGAVCRRGQCTDLEGSGSICLGEPVCFWAWDEKFPD